MRKGKRFLSFLKFSGLLAAAVICVSCRPLGGDSALTGRPAPDFTLDTLRGQFLSMTQARDSRPAIIFFWTTWCPHCREQLQELTRQREAIAASGIAVILVNVGETAREVGAFVRMHGVSFDVFLDKDSKAAEEYEIVGVPTFFLINGDGTIVAVTHLLVENYAQIISGTAM